MQRGGQSWQRRKPLAPLRCAMYSWPAPVCAQTKGGGGGVVMQQYWNGGDLRADGAAGGVQLPKI